MEKLLVSSQAKLFEMKIRNLFNLTLLSIVLLTNTGCSQSVGVKDKITTSNAHLITDFDSEDIESLVTYYFASRIRQDNEWMKALPDSSTWSGRMKASIKRHNEWNFIEFQNLGLYEGKYGTYVKVYFQIEMNGRTDEGEDDVEIRKENGRWIISKVPM